MTTGRLVALLAVVSLLIGCATLAIRSYRFRELAHSHREGMERWGAEFLLTPLGPGEEQDRWTMLDRGAAMRRWHGSMADSYDRAAARPWLSVETIPPPE